MFAQSLLLLHELRYHLARVREPASHLPFPQHNGAFIAMAMGLVDQ